MIGMARANNAHKKEGYKKLIRTKLIKKCCQKVPHYMVKGILVLGGINNNAIDIEKFFKRAINGKARLLFEPGFLQLRTVLLSVEHQHLSDTDFRYIALFTTTCFIGPVYELTFYGNFLPFF